MIPISVVQLGSEEEERVLRVIRSGVIAQGPVVAELEERFADLVGVRHAVAVNNGTTALIASLAVLDLEPGDEVITSPFTFAATLNAILDAGATARFADISEGDFCVDPDSVRSLVGPRTKVLMPVHLYGQAAPMTALGRIAEENSLAIVEDAAQAHGAKVDGRMAGSHGIGCFSLYATKNLTTGEGGIITTDDDDIAAKLRILRNQGMRQRYEYVMAGNNYRLTDLQAALALPQLDRYAALVEKRGENAAALSALLADVDGITVPSVQDGRTHVWHQYTVLLPEGASRDEVVSRMSEAGVSTGVYYPRLVHDYAPYQDREDVIIDPTPVAKSVAARCLSLPVHPHLTDGDLETIAAALRKAVA
ncbi:DegT/DnrJ/EryC1/StrS aminotransferase family protein [Naasia sp. SYSU D00948]|uniref:DegT/DnrJ/EryC1/StrS family aminotransferase n=1 Tax=Naasia sp. SYSU D00948 TaxID=2817379 RepID=UPI001B30B967|nr:DegT/DnrJ/EryC1/StrS family aminotransferase [Naasia sp. SYSU D00948]